MIKLLSSKSPTGWFLPSSQPSGVEHKHIFEATNQTMRAFSEAKNGNLKTSKNGGLISKQSDLTSNTRDHFQHECSDCSGNKPRLFLMVFLTYRWLGGLYSALDTAVVNLTTARRNILKIGDPAWKREFNGENDHQPVDLGEFRVCLDLKTAGMRSSLYNINIIQNNTAQYSTIQHVHKLRLCLGTQQTVTAKQCWRMLASRIFIHYLSKVFWDNRWRYPKNEKWPGGWARKWGHLASIKLDGRYHKTSNSHSDLLPISVFIVGSIPCVLGEIICCKSQHPASHHPHGQTVFLVAAIFLMPTTSGMTSNYWTIYHI